MTTRDLVTELKGTKCRCGAAKKAMQTFCQACYFSLPQEHQRALYRRIGSGYEEAYADAVEILDAKRRRAQ